MYVSEEIKRLHELHQAGALSDEEFAQAKARLLNANPPPRDGTEVDLPGELNRLRRSRSDRWISGVCGGLARVSKVDSWVWRLVFTLFTLTFGFGAVIYLLLWIFVPEE
jgi:phage shock protein PspC (stress-responsive transcriptional regulator)